MAGKEIGTSGKKIVADGIDSSQPEKLAEAANKGEAAFSMAKDDNENSIVSNTAKKIGFHNFFKIRVHKQSTEHKDGNKPVFIPNHDGGKDWMLIRGKEYIVPDYVVNILREANQVELVYNTEDMYVKRQVTTSVEIVPRFSFDVLAELGAM